MAPSAPPPQLATEPAAGVLALPQTTEADAVGAGFTTAPPMTMDDSDQLQQAQDYIQVLQRALREAQASAALPEPDVRGNKRSAEAAFASLSSSSSSSIVPTSVQSDAARAAAQRSALDEAFRSDDDKGPDPIFGTGTHPEAQLIANQKATFNEMRSKIQEKFFKTP